MINDLSMKKIIYLLQLATRVAFHEHLLPVCLPPPGLSEVKPGTMCTVIGWGKKEDKKREFLSLIFFFPSIEPFI